MLFGGEDDLRKAIAVDRQQLTMDEATLSQPRMEFYEQILYSFGRKDLLLVDIWLPEERVLF